LINVDDKDVDVTWTKALATKGTVWPTN